MILPIAAYGNQVLRKKAAVIGPDYPGLGVLIADMWETMYASNGIGLAAPQVERPIRLFIVDTSRVLENMEPEERKEYGDEPGLKQVFINARMDGSSGEPWLYNEGCLSIPKIREDIERPEEMTLSWLDAEFQPHQERFSGISARVIFHEYDHIEGKLFIDYLKPLKKRLLKNRLEDISKGKVSVDYKMVFPRKG
ncbi:MAG TPA: peptide deformylase [Chitinophagaceae bacterium]|nr:peptide deformylase [Chitinophagaceae bacterium]